jgi:hypothetical protein
MRNVEKYLWKIRWAGRVVTTRVPFTEEEIRPQHPDAQRIDASRILVALPGTDAERKGAMQPRGKR